MAAGSHLHRLHLGLGRLVAAPADHRDRSVLFGTTASRGRRVFQTRCEADGQLSMAVVGGQRERLGPAGLPRARAGRSPGRCDRDDRRGTWRGFSSSSVHELTDGASREDVGLLSPCYCSAQRGGHGVGPNLSAVMRSVRPCAGLVPSNEDFERNGPAQTATGPSRCRRGALRSRPSRIRFRSRASAERHHDHARPLPVDRPGKPQRKSRGFPGIGPPPVVADLRGDDTEPPLAGSTSSPRGSARTARLGSFQLHWLTKSGHPTLLRNGSGALKPTNRPERQTRECRPT
jgi:hypothetical protein